MSTAPSPPDPTPLESINRLIQRRRSIKPLLMDPDAPVPDDLLGAILENANWAPTHGMTQPWRFHVFRGPARQKLADTLQSLYRKLTSESAFRPDKFEKLGKSPLLAPVAVAICMKRQESGQIPEIEEIEAVACAVQNMHLTASALGLGAFWSSPPVVYTDDMKPFLELTPADHCLGLLYLGWPRDRQSWPRSQRTPIANKITWHGA